MRKTLYVKFRNSLHFGYGECSKCGGNWGWKKEKVHMTNESTGLFLFCEECDKIVTKKKRWKALDGWKFDCVKQLLGSTTYTANPGKHIADIENTEFIEFPRNKNLEE